MLLLIFATACSEKTEVNKYFEYVVTNSSKPQINSFKNIAEDSIFHIHTEMIPSFIHETYNSYTYKSELSKELKSDFDVQSENIEREILMLLFHLKLNGKRMSKRNLQNHWKYYRETNVELEIKDSIKLKECVIKNFKNYNVGDIIEVKFDVEKSDYDRSRLMTYPSVYHQTKPKEKLEDSLVIQGQLRRKGKFPHFTDEMEMTNRLNPIMFEIKMLEINDTTIGFKHKGPTDNLRIGELFYIDLEGYGCGRISKVNE